MHRKVAAAITAGLLGAQSATGVLAVAPALAASPPTAHAAGAVAGNRVTMKFGPVQVTIVVSGRRITDVRASLPTERARSRSINNRAAPILRQEVLKAQSARIHVVSGATYTSHAYVQSLQSAINKARI